MPRKESYHHGNLRAALLSAALDLLREGGVEALSLREVARRAGVSPGAPYHHFKSRGDLVCELAQERLEHLDGVSRKALEGLRTPQEKLRAIGTAYVMYAAEHPAEFRLMFSPERGSPLSQEKPEGAPVFRVLLGVIDELRETGRDLNRETAAITAWSLVHGLADLLVDGPLAPVSADLEKVRTLAEQVTEGLTFVQT